jgi:hypothetical protein
MRKLQSWFGQWRSEGVRAGGREAEWWGHHNSFDEWRRSELNGLLEASILEQGCMVTCSDCGSPNWYPVNRLAAMLTCPGCSVQAPLPAEPERSGKFGIAEVKSSPRAFDANDLERIATVAEDWRPDTLLLAAPGTEWPVDVRVEFDRLAERLAARRITVKPWLLSWECPKGSWSSSSSIVP